MIRFLCNFFGVLGIVVFLIALLFVTITVFRSTNNGIKRLSLLSGMFFNMLDILGVYFIVMVFCYRIFFCITVCDAAPDDEVVQGFPVSTVL